MKLLYIIVIMLFGCNKKNEESIYILPKDYQGSVVIIYAQEDGSKERYLDGKRLYNIPSTGVLKTKFKPLYGRMEFPKYYYDKISVKNEISIDINNNGEYLTKGVVATLPTINKAYKNIDGTSEIVYSVFYVGDKKNFSKYSSDFEKIDILKYIK